MTQPDALHARLRAELDRRLEVARAATPGPWWWDESDDCMRLHGAAFTIPAGSVVPDQVVNRQILKAPKRGTPYAEYWPSREDAEHIALHDPSDAVRRYTGELEVLERHAIVWRDVSWLGELLSGEREECYEEIPVCGRCVPKHSHFTSRAVVPEGACVEVKSLAGRLGVSVDG